MAASRRLDRRRGPINRVLCVRGIIVVSLLTVR